MTIYIIYSCSEQRTCLLSVPNRVVQFVPPCQWYFKESRPNLLL